MLVNEHDWKVKVDYYDESVTKTPPLPITLIWSKIASDTEICEETSEKTPPLLQFIFW
jgi:hypothetical protein